MTVIRPNSVSGINSITVASGAALAVHKADGTLIQTIAGATGVSTFSSISVGTGYTDNSAAKSINIGIGASIAQHNDNTLSFGTNGDERLKIESNGDVTLTNTSSNPQLAIISAANGIGEIQFGDTADSVRGNILYRSGSAGDALCFNGYNNTERVRITSAGDVGIGTAAAARSPIHIHRDNAECYVHITNSTTGTGSGDGFTIHQSGVETLLNNRETGNMRLYTAGTERLRIDSSGRVLVGNTAARAAGDVTAQLQVEGTSFATASATFISNAGASAGNQTHITIAKSRGSSDGSSTILAEDDGIGLIQWAGADGTDINSVAAKIHAFVDGTPGSNDMPGRLVFGTTADGASTPTERVLIDKNGRMGINSDASGPDRLLHVSDSNNGGAVTPFRLTNINGSSGTEVRMEFECGVDEVAYIGAKNEGSDIGPLMFATATSQAAYPTEKMRLTNGGQLLIGATTPHDDELLRVHESGTNNEIANFRCSDANHAKTMISMIHMGSGDKVFFSFKRGGSLTQVGRILTSASSTTYQTSSDYRLKENVTAISDGITRLKTLKPYRFNFKIEPDKTVDGFFAHEVTAVPEAISGTKDEVETTYYKNSDTIPEGKAVGDVKDTASPVYQGIDQSKLVPLLTAALQEAITKIETLETKVAALEAA